MINTGQLQALIKTELSPHPILSLYLALDQTREARMQNFAKLTDKLKKALGNNGSSAAWDGLASDLEQVRRYLEEHAGGPERGLALFSCAPTEYFQAYGLPASVNDQIRVGPYPFIRPLSSLPKDYAPSLVILVDSRMARFFLEAEGEIRELEDQTLWAEAATSERNGDRGRTGDSHLSRRADQAVRGFLREATGRINDLINSQGGQQLMVGGPRGAVDALLAELPPHLSGRLSGSFTLESNASLSQVAQEAAQVRQGWRQRRQENLLANLQDNLGRGGQATSGLNEVLASLYEGQVHTMLVAQDFCHPGGVCPGCGRLRHVAGVCPICETEMTPVDDVINLAVAAALGSGAAVEELPGQSPLNQLGNVAALLRYA
jgi:peptide chain release factor subunit 1